MRILEQSPLSACDSVHGHQHCQGFLLSGGMLSAVDFKDFGACLGHWSRIGMSKVVSLYGLPVHICAVLLK